MKIRRFFAPDIRQAMRLVREAQGPDAVILSNRKVDGGVEIVAAVDFDETLLSPATSGDGASTTQATAPQAPSARVASQLGMFRTAAQATSEQPPATPSAPRSAPTPKPAAAAPSLPPTPRLPATAQPAAGVKSMTANLAAPTALNKPTASKPSTPTPTPLPQTATKAPPARVPSYNPPEARIPAGSKWPNVGNHINETDEDGDIHLECVSNRFLSDADKLFSDEEAMLRILGFNEPTPGPDSTRPNWWYDSEGLDVITACSVIVEVLFGIFGITLDDPVWLLQRELVPTTSGTEN